MTDVEKQSLYEAIKRNAPAWYEKTMQDIEQKKNTISTCIKIAKSYNDDYQDKINKEYNASGCHLNDTETILLNYICLIRHKELANSGVQKNDPEIKKWLTVLVRYIDSAESVIGILYKHVRKTIRQYQIKNRPGRPKGKGKRVFSYNDKEYHTLQECANDYGITKQAIHKKLKKLKII